MLHIYQCKQLGRDGAKLQLGELTIKHPLTAYVSTDGGGRQWHLPKSTEIFKSRYPVKNNNQGSQAWDSQRDRAYYSKNTQVPGAHDHEGNRTSPFSGQIRHKYSSSSSSVNMCQSVWVLQLSFAPQGCQSMSIEELDLRGQGEAGTWTIFA